MEKMTLSIALSDSLKDETTACITELAEVGLDSIMDDGVLKDIPFISTAVSIYKIGNSIKDRHNIKKLAHFLDEINRNLYDINERDKYKKKITEHEKFRDQQLEYLLVLIERYVGYKKPRYLAKIYLAYLEDKISWEELLQFSEVIDRFLFGDCELLCSSTEFVTQRDTGVEGLLRLIGSGLVVEKIRKSNVSVDGGTIEIDKLEIMELQEKKYHRTQFGNKLVEVLTMSSVEK